MRALEREEAALEVVGKARLGQAGATLPPVNYLRRVRWRRQRRLLAPADERLDRNRHAARVQDRDRRKQPVP